MVQVALLVLLVALFSLGDDFIWFRATKNINWTRCQSNQHRESFRKQSHISSEWDNQVAIEHIIGSDEKLHFMFRCARIQGLAVHDGLLLFGQSYFYIIDGFTLLKIREIIEIINILFDVHEPIVQVTPPWYYQSTKKIVDFLFFLLLDFYLCLGVINFLLVKSEKFIQDAIYYSLLQLKCIFRWWQEFFVGFPENDAK